MAARLIDASSRIAVCGQPPVSIPRMRSEASTCARVSASASSRVKMSLVITANDRRGARMRQSSVVSVVLPAPTGPPMPTRRGPWGELMS